MRALDTLNKSRMWSQHLTLVAPMLQQQMQTAREVQV